MSLIVLIVDDDKAFRFFHQLIVTQSGLSAAPLIFCNGAEAFEYLDQQRNETDTYLILLDLNMPVMNGWELLEAIRCKSYCNRVNAVMVTSSVNRADQEKAKLYGTVMDVVEKPISEEVCTRIKNFSPVARYFQS